MGIFNLFTTKTKKIEQIDSEMIESLKTVSNESQRILENVIKYINEDLDTDIEVNNENIYYFRLFSGICVIGAFFVKKRRIKHLSDFEMQTDLNIGSGVAYLPFENKYLDRDVIKQSTINLCNDVLKILSPNLKLIEAGAFKIEDNIIVSLTSISTNNLSEYLKSKNSKINLNAYNHYFQNNVYQLMKLMNQIINS